LLGQALAGLASHAGTARRNQNSVSRADALAEP
jgi:hypothetical protein